MLTSGLVVEFADQERALGAGGGVRRGGHQVAYRRIRPGGLRQDRLPPAGNRGAEGVGVRRILPPPLDRAFSAEVDDPDVKRLFLDLVRRTLEDGRWGRLAMAVFDLTREILRRRKVAVIADDVFQAIGLDKSAAYVKGLLNMIEHPQYKYENIVVLVATSEGVSRREIGGHRWARLMPMWNMARDGFM